MAALIDFVERGTGRIPLVLLHGIGFGAESFAAQLVALGRERRVVAWNMPGYGASPPVESLTFPLLAKALVALLDRLGAERADLVGHSMGGMVALEALATYPERVRSAVLTATTPLFGSRDGSFQDTFIRARTAPLDAGLSMRELAETAVPELVGEGADPATIEALKEAMGGVPPATWRAVLRCLATFDRHDSLAAIRVPVLAIAGEQDRSAPLKTMARMADAIPGARLVVFPGCGHVPMAERPEAFNREVAHFLADLPNSPA